MPLFVDCKYNTILWTVGAFMCLKTENASSQRRKEADLRDVPSLFDFLASKEQRRSFANGPVAGTWKCIVYDRKLSKTDTPILSIPVR